MRAKDNMPALGDLRLFDSCVTLGRVVHSRHPRYLTADNILGPQWAFVMIQRARRGSLRLSGETCGRPGGAVRRPHHNAPRDRPSGL